MKTEFPFCDDEADYLPCICADGPEGKYVGCFNVPIDDVTAIFRNPNTESYQRVRLNLNSTDEMIPADVLNSRTVSSLEIHCPNLVSYQLQVDPAAFRPSSGVMTSLEIANCDLMKTDFSFLSGFSNLEQITFTSCSNFQPSLSTLPALSGLVDLAIHQSYGLREITSFPKLSRGLKAFRLFGNAETSALNDAAAKRFLDWILESSSATLETLQLNYNVLTEVPEQIPSFTSLSSLSLQNNFIALVRQCSLVFTAPVKTFLLHSNKLRTIQPGAIQGLSSNSNLKISTFYLNFCPTGDFSQTKAITFIDNGMSRLEGNVFAPLLDQLRDTDTIVSVELSM